MALPQQRLSDREEAYRGRGDTPVAERAQHRGYPAEAAGARLNDAFAVGSASEW